MCVKYNLDFRQAVPEFKQILALFQTSRKIYKNKANQQKIYRSPFLAETDLG